MTTPSESVRYLASYLKDNNNFITTVYDFDKERGKEYSFIDIDLDILSKTIQEFYDTLP